MKKYSFIIICALLSLNAGFSQWEESNNGLYGGYVYVLATDPITDYVYTGTPYNGVFLSTDNGSSWTRINNGLTNLEVHSITISGNKIFAGLAYGGVWKRLLSDFETNENTLKHQNYNISIYPNPVTDYLLIDLKANYSQANFELFDIHGRRILSKEITSGELMNIQGLKRGIYFYNILINGNKQSGKLIKE